METCNHEYVHVVVKSEIHKSFDDPTPQYSSNKTIVKDTIEDIKVYCKKCGKTGE